MSLIRGALMKGGGLEWRRKWQFTPGFLPGKLENSYLVHTNLCNEFPSSSWSLELICSKREYHIYLLVRWLTFKLSFLVPLLISSYLFTFKSNLLIYRGVEIGFITNSRSFNIWKEKNGIYLTFWFVKTEFLEQIVSRFFLNVCVCKTLRWERFSKASGFLHPTPSHCALWPLTALRPGAVLTLVQREWS